MMVPDSPAPIWLSVPSQRPFAGPVFIVIPGIDWPFFGHMSWSWYQYVPVGWFAGMSSW